MGKWKHNALRHSYGSYRLALMQDPAKLAYEMGNSPQMVVRHYREVVLPEQAQTWFAIRTPQEGKVVQLPLGKDEGRRMMDEVKAAGSASGTAPAVTA